ncbi:MAG TPA: C1 family peptidase [Pirellulaceae bacterium]|nr:C1 family peptidase [Pirellulaceae bacterium]
MAKKKVAKKTARKKSVKRTPAAEELDAVERRLNCLPSPKPLADWLLADLDDAQAGLADASLLPEECDLRRDWWKINDQGKTGSCVGWAVADSVLRWHFVNAGRLPEDESLSTRFVWMAAKEIDEHNVGRPESFIDDAGTSLKAALDVARKYGCVTESVLPFEGRLYPGTSRAFYISAALFKINMYIRIQSIIEWKRWLVQQGPILIRVEVDKTWHNPSNGRLEFYDPFLPGDPRAGGHAAAVVGYTESGDFIIRNSWGSRWGSDGYAFASPLYVDRAVSEAFGVFV